MFGLFKKKSKVEKLQEKYSKLLQEAHDVSHRDRTKGDQLTAEADKVAREIEQIKNEESKNQ